MSTLEDLKPWVFFFFTTFVPCKTTPSFLFLHFSECLSMCTVGMCRVFSNTDMKKGFKVFPSRSIFQFPDTQLISQKNHGSFIPAGPPWFTQTEGCSARLRKEMLRDGGRTDHLENTVEWYGRTGVSWKILGRWRDVFFEYTRSDIVVEYLIWWLHSYFTQNMTFYVFVGIYNEYRDKYYNPLKLTFLVLEKIIGRPVAPHFFTTRQAGSVRGVR